MTNTKLHIGTSGFSYDDWLGNFYPQFCPKKDFLQFYSSKFKVVEIDSTYYKLPSEKTIKRWIKVTPDDFLFTAKFPKEVAREGDIEMRIDTTLQFIKTMRCLHEKLAILLLQLPYSFKPDKIENLFKLLSILPSDLHFALELRNKCWLNEDRLFKRLKEQNIAFCHIDHPWMPKEDIQTADFSYFRFLGDIKKIENDFSYVRNERKSELIYWKEFIQQKLDKQKDCFAFFNNHYSGHAPTTSKQFITLLEIDKV